LSAVLERMQAVFRDVFDDDNLALRSDLTAADVENWDSLTHINLIVGIEREFKVRFTTAEVVSLKNAGDLEALVQRKLGSRS
jgi:acyl carrier protein